MKPFLADYEIEVIKEITTAFNNDLLTTKQVAEQLENVPLEARRRMMEEYGKRKIIEVALETTFSYILDDVLYAFNMVKHLGYTLEDVKEVYKEIKKDKPTLTY